MTLDWNTRPLSPHIGCEVLNADVRRLSPALKDLTEALIYTHHMLVFRDQDLTPAELLDFTRLLGEIDGSHVQSEFTHPEYPDIFVISNTQREGRPFGTKMVGHHWHTDWAYKARPASFTLLYGAEVPARPHHTLFASQRRVYEQLTEEEKADLRGRQAFYRYEKTHGVKHWYAPLTEAQKAMTPTVSHPMLRIHPGTGKEGLFVNRADCVGVSGMSEEEGVAMVDALVERIVDPAHVYAHPWRPRDLVMWDNRVLLHAATPYDMENDRRLIYRTTTLGERPIAPRPEVAEPLAG
ncbi:TauD/TfdA family dioxygenase [Pigmentiphaga soli]|uniref:TauD/TfdA family dioxygenase n=1 Tax=Pigmentiphaga soli TaxID=1007095 RepID=A0ABP8GPV9_9BURK